MAGLLDVHGGPTADSYCATCRMPVSDRGTQAEYHRQHGHHVVTGEEVQHQIWDDEGRCYVCGAEESENGFGCRIIRHRGHHLCLDCTRDIYA